MILCLMEEEGSHLTAVISIYGGFTRYIIFKWSSLYNVYMCSLLANKNMLSTRVSCSQS